MATIFGLEYQSPDEIRAARNQQFEQLKANAANDPNTLAAISAQQAMSNIAPSKEEGRAQRLQELLGKIAKENQQMDGEDEFDYQVRVAKEIRNQVAGLSPEMALAANDQVTKISKAKLEQSKLKTANEAERAALDDTLYESRMAKSPVIFGTTANGQNIPLGRFPPGTPDEVVRAALAEKMEEYKGVFAGFDIGNGTDLNTLDEYNTFKGKIGNSRYNNSQRGEMVSAVTANKGFLIDSNSLLEDLTSPGGALAATGLGKASDAAETIGTLAAGLRSTFWKVATDLGWSSERIEADLAQQEKMANDLAAAYAPEVTFGQRASIVQGKIKALAYALAKTLDPGGRLSNQDVEMASQMLVGNSDPRVIAEMLKARVQSNDAKLVATYENILQDDTGAFTEADKKEVREYLKQKEVALANIDRLVQAATSAREQIGLLKQPKGGSAPAAGGGDAYEQWLQSQQPKLSSAQRNNDRQRRLLS